MCAHCSLLVPSVSLSHTHTHTHTHAHIHKITTTNAGVLKSESKIWSANGVGLVLGLWYFLEFVKVCPKKSSTLPGSVVQHMQGIGGFWSGSSLLAFLFGPRWVGNLGVALCVVMFASPLAALKVVLQTKSSNAIPLPFTLAAVFNCFVWSATGILEMHDHNIYVPNLLGLALGLTQLSLKVIFPATKHNPEAVTLPL